MTLDSVRTKILLVIGLISCAVLGNGDQSESHHVAGQQGILAKKGVESLAHRLGGAILKLGDKSLKEAFEPIRIHPKMLAEMEGSEELKVLSQVIRTVESIDCVGFDMFSTEAVSFVFVFSTQHGPWTVKCDTYIFRGQFFISKFSLTTSWEEMEAIMAKVVRLDQFLQITPKEKNATPDTESGTPSLKS